MPSTAGRYVHIHVGTLNVLTYVVLAHTLTNTPYNTHSYTNNINISPALGRQRSVDYKFKASLICITRPYLKKPNINITNMKMKYKLIIFH